MKNIHNNERLSYLGSDSFWEICGVKKHLFYIMKKNPGLFGLFALNAVFNLMYESPLLTFTIDDIYLLQNRLFLHFKKADKWTFLTTSASGLGNTLFLDICKLIHRDFW